MQRRRFHFAGISAKNVTLGVPRLEELIKASKRVKTPTLSVYLDYDAQLAFGDRRDSSAAQALRSELASRAQMLVNTIKQIRVRDLTRRMQVLYSPLEQCDANTREGALLRRWQQLTAPEVRAARANEFGPLLDWVLRIDLSRSRLFERRMTVASVGHALLRHYDGAIDLIYSDENDVGAADVASGQQDSNTGNCDQNDDGGFVLVRMHAYALFDALRTVLPAHHRALLREVEVALEEAERRAAAAADDVAVPEATEAMEMRAKKRLRRDASAKKSALSASAVCTTARGATPVKDASGAPCGTPRTPKSGTKTSATEPPHAAKHLSPSQDNGAVERTPINGNDNDAEDKGDAVAAAAAKKDTVHDQVWGHLDVRSCFPLIMQHLTHDCGDIVLGGVEGISGVLAREVPRTHYDAKSGERVDHAREWLLETDGNNLLGSFSVRGIDHRRTRCNNPVEVAKVLGIEAARRALFEELRAVLQFDGAYVNCRHISLLCDIMTNAGALMSVSRHGLNRRRTGPLMRATLEESVSMVANAGCFSEFDPVAGPSERVATGRAFAHGTGSHVALIPDTDALQSAQETHVVSLADSFRASGHGIAEWNVDRSPFAPLADANKVAMLAEMRDYVRKERESAERARQEHEKVVRELHNQKHQAHSEHFDLGGGQAPFARPTASTVHGGESEHTGGEKRQMPNKIVNPFAQTSAQPQESVFVGSEQKTDDCAAFGTVRNPFQSTGEVVRPHAADIAATAAPTRQFVFSDALDECARAKFANPFAAADTRKTECASGTVATQDSANGKTAQEQRASKNVYFYVPSLPLWRKQI